MNNAIQERECLESFQDLSVNRSDKVSNLHHHLHLKYEMMIAINSVIHLTI